MIPRFPDRLHRTPQVHREKNENLRKDYRVFFRKDPQEPAPDKIMFWKVTVMRKDPGFLSLVFDNILENIVVVDAENYEILHANQSFIESYGDPLEGSRKRRCYEVTHRIYKPCHESGEECPVRLAADTGCVSKCVHVHQRKEGGARSTRLTAYPIRECDGKILRVVEISEDVTEQVVLQEEIRRKSDLLDNILKNCPDGIIGSDPAGNLFLFNEGAEKIYGYSAAEAIGKIHASALYPPGGAREVKEFIHAEGFGGRGRLQDFETEIMTSAGTRIPIRLSCELLHENGREIGTIGFFHDISGRLALQNHLAESEAKFRTLFETASDAILSIDENGLILMANRAAKHVFEYPGQEIAGLDVRRLLGSGQDGTWEVLARYASRSESGKYVESSAVSRFGKKISFHISISESIIGGKRFYTVIMRDVSQIKAYEEDLQVLANTDSLTRLFNRRQLYPIMQNELDRAVRKKIPFSVLLIDIDHFKKFNDTYGHAGGDLLLAGFADKMRSSIRQMDSAFRFGGEEFIVLLPEATGQAAMVPAERFRRLIADSRFPTPPGNKPVSVTISIGVAAYSTGDTLDDVIRHADLAMYAAKNGGRNRVVDFDQLVKPETT
jgi:diguanylate cyclase (GGDEF)-like protein/PAS domain S-box-containing protein